LILIFTYIPVTTKPAHSNELYKIEPGWRVGPVIMTMTESDVERIYGNGKLYVIPDIDKDINLKLLQYPSIGLSFIFKNGQMEEIEISYPNFKVKDVVSVGSSVSVVEEVMGKNYIRENYQHSYEAKLPDYKMIYSGIIFYVKKNRVVRITVKRVK